MTLADNAARSLISKANGLKFSRRKGKLFVIRIYGETHISLCRDYLTNEKYWKVDEKKRTKSKGHKVPNESFQSLSID